MAEDSNAWVFDSLICFLNGPIWNAPLQTFIEERCLIFDPNDKSGERKVEYKKVHDEYKHLVDYMLSTFMDEMQITPEQFEIACLAGRQGHAPGAGIAFTQSLFQQIWAANDIKIFIRMMTQRNVELQLQAIDMIERKHRLVKKHSEENAATASGLNEMGKQKIENEGATSVSADVTKEELEQIAASEAEAEREIISAIEKEFENISIVDTNQTKPDKSDEEDAGEIVNRRLNILFENKHKVDSEDIKNRQEYLRMQRDKILAIKKKARAHKLNETVKKGGRPTSAQAAQKILLGAKIPEEKPDGDLTDTSMQLRKTLAKRLREEVVDIGQ